MKFGSMMKNLVGAGIAAVAFATPAVANTILLQPTAVVVPDGTFGSDPAFKYTYNVVLNVSSAVRASDPSMFALLDVSGYVGGSALFTPAAGNFSLSEGFVQGLFPVGSDGTNVNPLPDSPFVYNISGAYTGPNLSTTALTTLTLGTLSFRTIDGNPAGTLKVASFDRVSSGADTTVNLANTAGPSSGKGPVGTPLPSAAFGGLALLGFFGVRRTRKA